MGDEGGRCEEGRGRCEEVGGMRSGWERRGGKLHWRLAPLKTEEGEFENNTGGRLRVLHRRVVALEQEEEPDLPRREVFERLRAREGALLS